MSKAECIISGCFNPVHCRLKCRRHYDKWRNRQDTDFVQIQRKHGAVDGGEKTREYRSWSSAKSRCFTTTHSCYPEYGGRGISMCPRYANSFSEFLSDIGPRPSKTSLDRINNSLGYNCGSCEHCVSKSLSMNIRWANQSQQTRNTRRNVQLTYQGRTQCLTDWSIELGINRSTLNNRIKRGWSTERALSLPSGKYVVTHN